MNNQLPRSLLRFATSSDVPENRLIVNPKYIHGNSLRSGCSGISWHEAEQPQRDQRVDADDDRETDRVQRQDRRVGEDGRAIRAPTRRTRYFQ